MYIYKYVHIYIYVCILAVATALMLHDIFDLTCLKVWLQHFVRQFVYMLLRQVKSELQSRSCT